MERIGNKVSYIRKPIAKYSFVAAGLAAASLIMAVAAVWMSYRMRGNAPLNVAALGLCSMVTAMSALVYGIFSFFEKDKNYLLAKISLSVAGVLILGWLIVIALG